MQTLFESLNKMQSTMDLFIKLSEDNEIVENVMMYFDKRKFLKKYSYDYLIFSAISLIILILTVTLISMAIYFMYFLCKQYYLYVSHYFYL